MHPANSESDVIDGQRVRDTRSRDDTVPWYDTFPWWMVLMAIILTVMVITVLASDANRLAFERIIPGLGKTINATLWAFFLSCTGGLLLALARTSGNGLLRNVSRTYVEFIRGIPMLVLIFTFTYVVVPKFTEWIGQPQLISPEWRAIVSLALIYAGYIAEIFRAGIESVSSGQVEAGRSLGLSRRQTTRAIVLPQALRAVIPPLGNDFIAVLKDTSLLSAVGVLELTLRARQFSAGTFQFQEAYLSTTLIYLSLTLILSAVLHVLEGRMSAGQKGARA